MTTGGARISDLPLNTYLRQLLHRREETKTSHLPRCLTDTNMRRQNTSIRLEEQPSEHWYHGRCRSVIATYWSIPAVSALINESEERRYAPTLDVRRHQWILMNKKKSYWTTPPKGLHRRLRPSQRDRLMGIPAPVGYILYLEFVPIP